MNIGLGSLAPTVVGATKNANQKTKADTQNQSNHPVDEQDRVRFGVITEVSSGNLVKVKFLNNLGEPEGDNIAANTFLALITPLSVIHLLYGDLRKGLICRVWWKGKLEPIASSTFVEIIADENHNFLQKEPESNEMTTGPVKIFSGGLLG